MNYLYCTDIDVTRTFDIRSSCAEIRSDKTVLNFPDPF